MAAGGATDSDAEMRAFIGVNWRAYEDVWSKVKTSPRLQASRNFSAAVFYLLLAPVSSAISAGLRGPRRIQRHIPVRLLRMEPRGTRPGLVFLQSLRQIDRRPRRRHENPGHRDAGPYRRRADFIRDSGGVDPLAAALGALAFGASAYWNLSQAVRQAEPAVGMLQSVLAIFLRTDAPSAPSR